METKPGIRTTEFWGTIIVQAVLMLNLIGIWDYMPNKYSALAMALVQGAYAIARGQAKQGVSYNNNNNTQ